MKGWPLEVIPHIENARSEAARELADNISGWSRRDLLRIIGGELHRGAFGNAVVVMASGLMPAKIRSLFRGGGTDKSRAQIAATFERPS